MADKKGDGSIVLKTKVDTSGIKQGTSSISAMVKKAGSALAVAFSVKKIYEFVKASVDAFAEFEQLVGGVETLFKNSSNKVRKYANEAYKTAGMSANEYMKNVTAFSASLLSSLGGDTDKAADVANNAIISISDNVNKMGSDYQSVQLAFQGFAKQQYMLLDNLKLGYGGTKTEMERLLKDAQAITGVEYNIDNLADVYTAIGVIQEKLGIAGTTAKEAATTISGSAATMRAAWQNVLTAISGGGDMDSAINNLVDSVDIYVDNILPVVEKALIGIGVLIEKIAPKLAETVGKAFIAQIPNLITAIYAMIVGAFKGIFSGTVALFKKETKDLFGEQTEKIEESAKKQEEFTDAVKDTNKELKKTLAGFDEIQILSTSAQEENEIVPMQMSKDSKLSDSSVGGSEYVRQVDETLNAIMGIVALCLAAVGLILIFTGANIAFGIGFVVAGAATLGVSMSSLSKTDVGNDVIQMLLTITAVASGALLAIGIMLCFLMGASPVSVGLIVAGGALLVGSVGALIGLNPDDIASWLSIIMGIAGGAMLALGIILCMVGSIPVGVGLIISGAVSLVSAVVLNFDSVKNSITGWVAAIMSIVGAALLVVGIILVCTGVGIPVGIALIAAGAAALVTPIALNWDAIVDWVKGAWDAVKNFWNTYIAPVFTAEFWLNLGKTCINGLIAGFESGINGIIWAFESMINWIVDGLNKISFDIPDWLGGGHFGINLPRASFGRVSIPRLAQGAVIPPNKEFLAVLGDQRQGTNIEAPLQTIVDAFNIALAQNGGAGGGNTEVVLEIDGREFGRAVVEQGNRENRRIGTRLVIG